MFKVFEGINGLLKLEKVCIDNNIFRLHYKLTTVLLIVCSVIVTARQYIGHPIECTIENKDIKDWINTYCWIMSTYTVTNKVGKPGIHVVQPGVANSIPDVDELKHQRFYQWVCFTLFFQAVLFYIPRYIWKYWEGGRIKAIANDLKFASLDPDLKSIKRAMLVQYFQTNLKHHNLYFFKFFFCELLNFVNVIGQMFLMNTFLENTFFTYGLEVLKFDNKELFERIDPMTYIFPKVAKCKWYMFGPSGTIQTLDALCVLPLNIVHEKIYIFMWFWFIILTTITSLAIVYRLVTIVSGKFRYILLKAKCRALPAEHIKQLCETFSIGDWFVFIQLCHNVEALFFKELVQELSQTFKDISRSKSEDP